MGDPAFFVDFMSRIPGVSSLWTPEGERPVNTRVPSQASPADTGSKPGPGFDAADGPDAEWTPDEQRAVEAQLERLRGQMLSTPVEVVVANHVYGLFELAAIHLSEKPPSLGAARLAVDAMGAIGVALQGRLGEAEASLNDALAQIRLACVQIAAASESSPTPAGSNSDSSTGPAHAAEGS